MHMHRHSVHVSFLFGVDRISGLRAAGWHHHNIETHCRKLGGAIGGWGLPLLPAAGCSAAVGQAAASHADKLLADKLLIGEGVRVYVCVFGVRVPRRVRQHASEGELIGRHDGCGWWCMCFIVCVCVCTDHIRFTFAPSAINRVIAAIAAIAPGCRVPDAGRERVGVCVCVVFAPDARRRR